MKWRTFTYMIEKTLSNPSVMVVNVVLTTYWAIGTVMAALQTHQISTRKSMHHSHQRFQANRTVPIVITVCW
jgi:hypothetical protein